MPAILTEAQAMAISANGNPFTLEYTADGHAIKSTCFTNYCDIMEKDAYLSGKIRQNLLDGRPEVEGFFWDAERHPIRDTDMYQIRRFIDRLYEINNEKNIRQAVAVTAGNHAYHPIREYLQGLTWDGTSRLQDLFPRYLGAERSGYTTAVTRLLFSGAIQRIFNPGVKFDYCIILQDTKQGTGKSTLCRAIALNDEWFTDSVGDLSDSKKAFESIRGKWIVELGELIAVRKTKDVEAIKAFISRQQDIYRDPYGIYPEAYKRQAVFIGTTNKPQFLPEDRTGNRRFIPLKCNGDQQEIHPMENEEETREYVRQCYAEVMASGAYTMVLPVEYLETLQNAQEEATPEDTWIGMIQQFLDDSPELTIVCTRLIWHALFAGDQEREPKRYELNDIADIMELHVSGWKRYAGKHGNNRKAKYKFEVYGAQNAWVRIGATDRKKVASVASAEGEEGFTPIDKYESIPF